MPDPNDLVAAAAAVRENAYVPYSRFKVGAALKAADGSVHRGCNVENVAYPEGTCAEAGAIAAMVAAGQTRFAEAAVIADSPVPVTPCGGCRQKLIEFAAPGATITMATTDGKTARMAVADLLPGAFDQAQMDNA
ncbi:MAG: cytidine deaminase [Silicimonas sp.]|jgi:cytidine deaminase|nr:cytidine deaminase [Silicimonas sp.]